MEKLQELLSYLPTYWNRDDFVLCGSACLAMRGIRDVHDLDVLIRPALWPDVQRIYREGGFPEYDEDRALMVYEGSTLLRTGEIDFFDRPARIEHRVEEVFAEAGFLNGYQVISIRHCLAIKALVRPPRIKDRWDMQMLVMEL